MSEPKLPEWLETMAKKTATASRADKASTTAWILADKAITEADDGIRRTTHDCVLDLMGLMINKIEQLRGLLQRWVNDADQGKLDGVDLVLMVESEEALEIGAKP